MDVSRSSSSCPRASCSLVQGPPAPLSWILSWLTAQSLAGCPYIFSLWELALACCILLFDLWQIKQWSYPAHFLYLLCAAEEVFFQLIRPSSYHFVPCCSDDRHLLIQLLSLYLHSQAKMIWYFWDLFLRKSNDSTEPSHPNLFPEMPEEGRVSGWWFTQSNFPLNYLEVWR